MFFSLLIGVAGNYVIFGMDSWEIYYWGVVPINKIFLGVLLIFLSLIISIISCPETLTVFIPVISFHFISPTEL